MPAKDQPAHQSHAFGLGGKFKEALLDEAKSSQEKDGG